MKRLILAKRDYEIISNLLAKNKAVDPVDIKCREKLKEEMSEAVILEESEMPNDVIRLNSIVTVNTPFGRKAGLQLVLPGLADFQQGKLSITSPMGLALIGYQAGDEVNWHFPNGDEIVIVETVEYRQVEEK